MPLHLESLKAEISRLPLQDRAILAKHIIYSFDKEEELEVEKIGLRKSQGYTKGEIQSKSTETVFQIEHPYITSHQDYCGGSPVIVGTKFPVHSVVNYVLKQGLTVPKNRLKTIHRSFALC